MKEFFNNLLSDSSKISSKRLISLYSLLLLTVVIVCLIYQIKIDIQVVFALIALITGSSAMTLANKKEAKNNDDEGNKNKEEEKG